MSMKQFKRARKEAGLSQRQASKLLDIKLTDLARIEKGEKLPSEALVDSMVRTYGVSAHYLTTGKPKTFGDYLADGAPLAIAMQRATDE